MKQRHWKCRRQGVEHPRALSRWDQAYQCLLRWTNAPQQEPVIQEEIGEHRSICSCFGSSPSADTDHRTTIGTITDTLPV